jgi:hypothetical protein
MSLRGASISYLVEINIDRALCPKERVDGLSVRVRWKCKMMGDLIGTQRCMSGRVEPKVIQSS